jgi:hypothetical protein
MFGKVLGMEDARNIHMHINLFKVSPDQTLQTRLRLRSRGRRIEQNEQNLHISL